MQYPTPGQANENILKVKVQRESCEVEIIIIGPEVSFLLLVGRVQRSYTRIQNQLKLKHLKPWITVLETHNHDMNCNDFSFSCIWFVVSLFVCFLYDRCDKLPMYSRRSLSALPLYPCLELSPHEYHCKRNMNSANFSLYSL